MSKGNSGPAIEFVSVSKAFLCFAVHHASSHLGCLASYAASPTPRPVCKMLGNGRPSGTGIGEKGDTDRGLLPLTDQQFRHRRKLRNGFKVLAMTPSSCLHSRREHRGSTAHVVRLGCVRGACGLLRWPQNSRYTRSPARWDSRVAPCVSICNGVMIELHSLFKARLKAGFVARLSL